MLELGLVDEAKATVNKWMARWIELVSTLPISKLVETSWLMLSAVIPPNMVAFSTSPERSILTTS